MYTYGGFKNLFSCGFRLFDPGIINYIKKKSPPQPCGGDRERLLVIYNSMCYSAHNKFLKKYLQFLNQLNWRCNSLINCICNSNIAWFEDTSRCSIASTIPILPGLRIPPGVQLYLHNHNRTSQRCFPHVKFLK